MTVWSDDGCGGGGNLAVVVCGCSGYLSLVLVQGAVLTHSGGGGGGDGYDCG